MWTSFEIISFIMNESTYALAQFALSKVKNLTTMRNNYPFWHMGVLKPIIHEHKT
jgi:hypothetical protein